MPYLYVRKGKDLTNEENKMEKIKNIGGSIGYDNEGNTYTRDVELEQNNKRVWGQWKMNNNLGCSGRSQEYYDEQNQKYNEIQRKCGVQ